MKAGSNYKLSLVRRETVWLLAREKKQKTNSGLHIWEMFLGNVLKDDRNRNENDGKTHIKR